MRRLPVVPSPDTIHPLKDVWLRPRRVFRELATSPIGITDYLLAGAQGVATSIALYRSQLAATHISAGEIFSSSIMFGPVGGVLSTLLFAFIYGRLGKRAGGTSALNQVFHVLAYGGLPVAASLLLWGFTGLFIGEAAIIETPGVAEDGFVSFVQRAQFLAWVFLLLWSVVLQIMGLSEILGVLVRKAFAVYVLGQVLALLAALFLSILIALLFPGVLPAVPH
ncbi:MAG TPA: YIP1 family protein [Steroidobacteraceae bacterium]